MHTHTSKCLPHSSFTFWTLKMRPLCFLETSGSNEPLTQHRIPENKLLSYTAVKTSKLTWCDDVTLKITQWLGFLSSVPKTCLGIGFVPVLKRKHIEAWELQNSSFQQSELRYVPPQSFTCIWNTSCFQNTELFWNTRSWTKILVTVNYFCFYFYFSTYAEH